MLYYHLERLRELFRQPIAWSYLFQAASKRRGLLLLLGLPNHTQHPPDQHIGVPHGLTAAQLG
jgi:hypothetical protein